MTISEKNLLKEFFEEEIIDLDDDEVDRFLDRFDQQEVLQCLFDQLKNIAFSNYPDESAWRLGRTFGDISKRYSADAKVFSWFSTCGNIEKKASLNFFSGYWDQTKPDFNTLFELSNILVKVTLAKEWPQELTQAGIDAVTNGYSSLEYRSKVDRDISYCFKEKIKVFESYLMSYSADSSDTRQTLKFVQSVLSE
jgi:hypothetical protein